MKERREAARRVVPVHPVLKKIIVSNDSDNEEYILKGLASSRLRYQKIMQLPKETWKDKKKTEPPKGCCVSLVEEYSY